MAFFEYWITFFGVFFRFGALSSFSDFKAVFFLKLVFLSCSFLVAIFYFLFRIQIFVKIIRSHPIFFSFLALAGFSISWNMNKAFGFLDFVRNLDIVLFSSYIVYRFEENKVLELFKNILIFIVIISLVTYVVDPVRATWGQGDDPLDSFTGFRFGLRGVMATKGHFAAIINISILYFFSKNNLISLRENFLSKLFYMFLLLVLFLASGSIASIFAMFFVLYFCNIFNSFTQKNSLKTLISVFLKVLIIPVIFLLNVQFRFLDTFFNRDFTTLTGRSDLWIIGLDLIKKNILLGYGPGGFCLSYELDGTKCEFTDNLSSLKAFVGTAPHNEIVNIVLSYGLVGLILFLLLYLNLYIRLFSLKRRKNIDSINFYFYFIIFSLTVQLLGGFFLSPLNAYWLVFTVIYFLIFHPRHDRSSSALA